MRRTLILMVAVLLAGLVPAGFALDGLGAAGGAPGAGQTGTGKRGPRLSGFYEFWQGGPEFTAGIGTIPDLTCAIGQSTQPAAYAGNMLLDCDAEQPHNETTIAVDPNDKDHAIGGYHSYLLSFNGSTVIPHIVGAASVTFDGGRTWREAIPPIRPYQFSGDPAAAFDTRGRVYYATIADHEGPGGSFTGPSVLVARSDDGGLNWNDPVTVARGSTAITKNKIYGPNVFNDKDYLTVDTGAGSLHRDRVYLTWTRFSQFISPQEVVFEFPIEISVSDDGVAWSPEREISGANPALCDAGIAGSTHRCDLNQDSYPSVAPGGKVYVSFENFNTPAENQILAVSSGDGGNTWSVPSRVDMVEDLNLPRNAFGDDVLTGCNFRFGIKGNTAADPSDPTGNTVYVVWADNRNGRVVVDPAGGTTFFTNTDVFLGRSSDGGRTWQVIPVDTSQNDQFFPWVAVAADGRVDVGYMDRSYSSGQDECRYGFSLARIKFDGAGQVASSHKMRVDTGLSDPGHSFWFSRNSFFIGDYNGISIDSAGRTWSLWTDMRAVVIPTVDLHGQHAAGALTE